MFDLTFPVSFTKAMSLFSCLGLDIAGDSGASCTWEMDYVDKLILQTLLPFGIAAALVLARLVHAGYYGTRFSEEEASKFAAKIESLNATYFQLFLSVLFLLLTSTVTIIFRMFPCQDVDPENESPGHDTYLRVRFCRLWKYYLLSESHFIISLILG